MVVWCVQEVRAERDVLQARMSEQALRISSLSARLTRQRHDADALAHAAHSQLGVQLHDANAEVTALTLPSHYTCRNSYLPDVIAILFPCTNEL